MTISEKLTLVSQNEGKVFNSGKDVGYSEGFNVGYDEGHTQGFDEGQARGSAEGWQQGLDEGIVIGKEQQYDLFWDAFQQNGTKTYYSHVFRSEQWNEITFKPKYPIRPIHAAYMLYSSLFAGDLTQNVILDFSRCENITYCFYNAPNITRIGEVDARMVGDFSYVFSYCTRLEKIDLVRLKNDGSQGMTATFNGCYALKDVLFDGTIGQTVSFQNCTSLSKDSITSIINALSSSVSGNSVSLSKDAVIEAFRSGENLLLKPYVDSTKVVNGITFTDNGDGTITANGTATADATFNVKVFKTTPNDSFALVGCPVGGSASTYYIAYEGYGRDYGNGVMWDGSRDFWDTVTIVIKNGTKVSNLKFAPQINNINEWKALIAKKSNWTINLL